MGQSEEPAMAEATPEDLKSMSLDNVLVADDDARGFASILEELASDVPGLSGKNDTVVRPMAIHSSYEVRPEGTVKIPGRWVLVTMTKEIAARLDRGEEIGDACIQEGPHGRATICVVGGGGKENDR